MSGTPPHTTTLVGVYATGITHPVQVALLFDRYVDNIGLYRLGPSSKYFYRPSMPLQYDYLQAVKHPSPKNISKLSKNMDFQAYDERENWKLDRLTRNGSRRDVGFLVKC